MASTQFCSCHSNGKRLINPSNCNPTGCRPLAIASTTSGASSVKAWAGPAFWAAIGQDASAYPELTVGGALHNIVVATIGNLVGGSLMVGAVYWFVYLRRRA